MILNTIGCESAIITVAAVIRKCFIGSNSGELLFGMLCSTVIQVKSQLLCAYSTLAAEPDFAFRVIALHAHAG